jgi:hypothetical protein
MRHEDCSFWNVNACSLVDRSVLKESYASAFSTNLRILKMVAPPYSKRQTRHYNQEDCSLRIHRLKKHLTCLPLSQEHYICRNWTFCFYEFPQCVSYLVGTRGSFSGLWAAGEWGSPLPFHLMPKLRMNDGIVLLLNISFCNLVVSMTFLNRANSLYWISVWKN